MMISPPPAAEHVARKLCVGGLRSGKVCCGASCGECRSSSWEPDAGCGQRPGGAAQCCARKILKAGRPCVYENSTGCFAEAAGAAAEHLCFWKSLREAGGTICQEQSSECLDAAMRDAAQRSNTTLERFRFETLQRCLWQAQPPPRVETVRRIMARGCKVSANVSATRPRPHVWMAAVIRDQTDLLAEWLLWHLLLGISKVLLYDNNSRDPAALRMVAAPFVEAGALVLLPWPQQCQTCAYDAAIGQAKASGVEFVACHDLDERIVPYGFGCIPDMMAHCTMSSYCAGLRLNTRWTPGAPLSTIGQQKGQSLLQHKHYSSGQWRDSTVKTIVRTSTHRPASDGNRWHTPHAPAVMRPWCLWDEELVCKEGHEQLKTPFMRNPATGYQAFVWHTQCRTLLEWIARKSLTGRIDEPCKDCFGSLEALRADYEKSCLNQQPTFKRRGPRINASAAEIYLQTVDARLRKALNPVSGDV